MREALLQVWRISILVLLIPSQNVIAQDSESEAITAILSLYRHHDVVMMGEQHGLKSNHDFRISLIKHPGFAEVVDDIVIESGNALYQRTLDEYILELKDVSDEELKKVWRNTTQTSGVWDAPIYEEFIRTVRKVNEGLPAGKRLRLLAGDPPIDWSNVREPKDLQPHFSRRDTNPAKIVMTEVVARRRKAFLIYGGLHIFRPNSVRPARVEENITALLESEIPGGVYVIMPIGGTNDDSFEFERLLKSSAYPRFVDLNMLNLVLRDSGDFPRFSAGSMIRSSDGIIFLGSHEEVYVETDPSALRDEEYQRELARRQAIVSDAVAGRSAFVN